MPEFKQWPLKFLRPVRLECHLGSNGSLPHRRLQLGVMRGSGGGGGGGGQLDTEVLSLGGGGAFSEHFDQVAIWSKRE